MNYPRYTLKSRVAFKLHHHLLCFGVITAVHHHITEANESITYTVENSQDSNVVDEPEILPLDNDWYLEKVAEEQDLFLDKANAEAAARNAANEPSSALGGDAVIPPAVIPMPTSIPTEDIPF